MTGSAPLSGIWFFPRKQGSVNRVTEDLFLLKRRQESETEKAWISLLLLPEAKQNKLVPQWNLGLVLAALNSPPFEPAEEVDLRFLYYKCCFLLEGTNRLISKR
jgi:hypothetical protein